MARRRSGGAAAAAEAHLAHAQRARGLGLGERLGAAALGRLGRGLGRRKAPVEAGLAKVVAARHGQRRVEHALAQAAGEVAQQALVRGRLRVRGGMGGGGAAARPASGLRSRGRARQRARAGSRRAKIKAAAAAAHHTRLLLQLLDRVAAARRLLARRRLARPAPLPGRVVKVPAAARRGVGCGGVSEARTRAAAAPLPASPAQRSPASAPHQ